MTDLYRAAKEKFPLNILIALILGIVLGYFIGTYISGGAGGKAIGLGCMNGASDGIRQGAEICDGGAKACSVGGYKGIEACNANCEFDACIATEYCGDGAINNGEQCDGSNAGLDCAALGKTTGTLVCDSTCKFAGCS